MTYLLAVNTTEHFERTMQLRPQIRREWCEEIAQHPEYKEIVASGRIRCWGWVPELNHYVRVVLLADGETLHTAMIDSKFSRRKR